MNVSANVQTESVQRLLKRMPSAVEVQLAVGMKRMANEHIATMTRRMTAAGDGLVKTRTGFMRDRFTSETRQAGGIGNLRTRVFVAGVKYADVQEFGGVIKPRLRKFLTIPMDAIKTAGGAIKGQYAGGAGEYRKTGKSFVWRNALGGAFIAEKSKNGKSLVLLWKLVRSVKIPGNLGWYKTWRGGEDDRRAILRSVGRRAIEKAARQ